MTTFQKIVTTKFRAFQFNLKSSEDLVSEGNLQVKALLGELPNFYLYDGNCEVKIHFVQDENPVDDHDVEWKYSTAFSIVMKYWIDSERRDILYEMFDTDWLVEDAESEGGFKVMKNYAFQEMLIFQNFTEISE
jgi:hypothetical protein